VSQKKGFKKGIPKKGFQKRKATKNGCILKNTQFSKGFSGPAFEPLKAPQNTVSKR
jgi:hypothetical protein